MMTSNFFYRFRYPVTIALLVFAGCSDDDDELTPEQRLVGTWTISQSEIDSFVGTQSLVDYLAELLDVSAGEAAALVALYEASLASQLVGSITFNADHTYTSNIGGDTGSGDWELSANGSTLTLDKGTADEVILTINALTATSLEVVLEQETEEDFDDEPSTPDTIVDAKATIELTKS